MSQNDLDGYITQPTFGIKISETNYTSNSGTFLSAW